MAQRTGAAEKAPKTQRLHERRPAPDSQSRTPRGERDAYDYVDRGAEDDDFADEDDDAHKE